MADDRDQAIRAILADAKRSRPRTPRWLWLLAGAVGLACTVGFAVLMTRAPGAPQIPAHAAEPSSGFGAGLAIGACVGCAVGYLVARHSSRRSP